MKDKLSRIIKSILGSLLVVLALIAQWIIIQACQHIPKYPSTENIDSVVISEMAKQNIVGMAVGIIRNGKIYYVAGYGHADLAREIPISECTIFRWASISKTLTAVAALKLDEESGNFNITDHVTKHVDYWPKPDTKQGNKKDILIEHLLSHRSGIIHLNKKEDCPGNADQSFDRKKHSEKMYNAEQAVEVFDHKDQPLCFDPGESSRYSNFGYNLLGSVIDEVSSKGYVDYVNKNIRDPLGMTSLRPAVGTDLNGFTQKCQVLKSVSSGNLSYILPGGGWESNIIDLAKFANGLINGSILNNTSRLWTTVKDNIIYGFDYGYGIFHENDKNWVWHGGKLDDVKTLLYLYPNSPDRLGIVLMINGGYVNEKRISYQLANLFGKTHTIVDNSPVVKPCYEEVCPGKFSAVWRHTEKDVLLRRGYGHKDFFAEFNFLREAGYYTDDFEPYVKNGKLLWDAIFRKGPGGNGMWRDRSKDEFLDLWEIQTSLNYHLVDIETHELNDELKWSGLFRPGSGKHDMDWYLSTDEFNRKWKEMKNAGYKLIDVEPFYDGEKLNWAGVWIEGEDGKLNRNLTFEEFHDLFERRTKNGWKLIDIERYPYGGEVRWAGIWEKSPDEEKLIRGYPYCGTKNDDGDWLSKGIINYHNDWRNSGYELIDWEYY